MKIFTSGIDNLKCQHLFLYIFRVPKAIVYRAVLLSTFLNPLNVIFFNLSANLARRFSPLRSALKVNMQCLLFLSSFLLHSSCHLPRSNHAHIPPGFRCKSYLNLSPAAMCAERGMDQNRLPGYQSNLQNEHEFVLWVIGGLEVGNKLTEGILCVTISISRISLVGLRKSYK